MNTPVLHNVVYHSDKGIDKTAEDIGKDWLDFGVNDPAEKTELHRSHAQSHCEKAAFQLQDSDSSMKSSLSSVTRSDFV